MECKTVCHCDHQQNGSCKEWHPQIDCKTHACAAKDFAWYEAQTRRHAVCNPTVTILGDIWLFDKVIAERKSSDVISRARPCTNLIGHHGHATFSFYHGRLIARVHYEAASIWAHRRLWLHHRSSVHWLSRDKARTTGLMANFLSVWKEHVLRAMWDSTSAPQNVRRGRSFIFLPDFAKALDADARIALELFREPLAHTKQREFECAELASPLMALARQSIKARAIEMSLSEQLRRSYWEPTYVVASLWWQQIA